MDSVEACQDYYEAKCRHSTCYYCERQVGYHEHDHFPLPRRYGGTKTVPACVDCHALKDRIHLHNWPLDVAFTAMTELYRLIPEEVRLELENERSHEAVLERPEWSYTNVMMQWRSLAPMTRVLFGKMLAMNENAAPTTNV